MPESAQTVHVDGFELIADADLTPRTTFGVPARARWLARVTDPAALPQLLERREFRDLPRLTLGGGSNLLFTRDFEGLVLAIESQGIERLDSGKDGDLLRVAAGENWDAFVRWSLEQGYAGLENLILIPGSVGAAPFQNIGAYGTEIREFVRGVRAWDSREEEFVWLDNDACEFAYRDSIFKRQRGRWLITELELLLPHEAPPRIHYPGVREALETVGIPEPRPTDVARVVEDLRRSKLPDPAITGNAGSFFKNPVRDATTVDDLKRRFPHLPFHELSDGRCKLSAAWLIEQTGFRGYRQGAVGVSEQHALVLVNLGGATGAEVWALAERIRECVQQQFGILLEPEPVVL